MKIRQLTVEQVLHFSQCTWNFGDAAGVHVLYGPNEAGKSTLLKLVTDLLFGGPIEAALQGAYTSRSRLAASLTADGRHEAQVVRRKKGQRLVLDATSTVDETDWVEHYLKGYDKARYQLLFGFDHQVLREGGQRLLQSGGHAGISLFEAGGGVRALHRLAEQLGRDTVELLDPGFRSNAKGLVNRAWRAYQDAERAARSEGLRADEWQEKRQNLERQRQRIGSLTESLELRLAQRNKIQRALRVRGPLADLHHLRERRAQITTQRLLPQELEEAISATFAERQKAGQTLSLEEASLNELTQVQASIQRDSEVLTEGAEIESLGDGLERYRSIVDQELVEADAQRRQIMGQAERQLAALVPTATWEEAPSLRISFADAQRIGATAEAMVGQEAQVEQALARRRDAQRQLTDLEHAIQAVVDPVPDVDGLRRVVATLQGKGDWDAIIEERRRDIQHLRDRLAELAGRQTIWRGGWEEAASLPVPLLETIDRYVEQWSDLEQAWRDNRREADRVGGLLEDIARQLRLMEAGGRPPVEDELLAIRRRRDQGWRLVVSAWLGQDREDPSAVMAYAGDEPLHEAFERDMQQSDQTVDAMRANAEGSARRALLMSQRAQADDEAHRLEVSARAIADRREQLAAAWQSEWDASRIQARTPVEMRQFVTAVLTPLVDGVGELRRLEAEADALGDERAACRQDLMKRMGPLADAEGVAIAPWVRRAEEQLARAEDAQRVRAALTAQARLARETLAAEDRAVQAAQQRIAGLQSAWQDLRTRHAQLPEEAAIARQYLERLQSLFDLMDESERLAALARDKEGWAARFQDRAEQVSRALGESGGGADWGDWVRGARARLRRAEASEQRWSDLDAQRATAAGRVTALRDLVHRLQGGLDQWRAEYGCVDDKALWTLLEESKTARLLEGDIRDKEQLLRDIGDGLSPQELAREAEALRSQAESDVWPSQVEALTHDISALTEERESARERLAEEQAMFGQWDGSSTRAADALQAAESHLAEVDRLFNRYVRLELARRVLNQAVENFREKNQGSIIEQASHFFEELTLGRYRELAVDLEGEVPYLEVTDRDQHTRRMETLSDGTRDQVFLALRLAFIAENTRDQTTPPLVLDDVFVHFDDPRTAAALNILQRLSEKTQVLYFTHHQSVADLAGHMGDTVEVHRVDQSWLSDRA